MSNGTDTMDSERKLPKGNMGHTKGIGDPYGMKIKSGHNPNYRKLLTPHNGV